MKALLDSHDKFLHYDALNADDAERMQANQAALQVIADQVGKLDPSQKCGEQYEVFRSAIDELHRATQLAYAVASDPTSAPNTISRSMIAIQTRSPLACSDPTRSRVETSLPSGARRRLVHREITSANRFRHLISMLSGRPMRIPNLQ